MHKPKIALVYDWITTPYGGAEDVLLALSQAFPEAPLYTSVYNEKTAVWAKNFVVISTFIQHFPLAKQYFRAFGPLMPLAFETLDLTGYDIVISITSSFAKSVITQPHQLHICYLLTPNRHLYSHRKAFTRKLFFPFTHLFTQLLKYLTYHDQAAAQRPDIIIPISQLVAERTREYYHRKTAKVIYPPINVKLKGEQAQRLNDKSYYLVVSRLVPYKQIELAIQACQEMGRDLIIVGTGPELNKLKRITNNQQLATSVLFLENVDANTLADLYHHARGLLMPGLEDFGITAVEAVAQGVPVILHHKSGAAEIIRHLKDGIHLQKSSLAELLKAMHTLEMTTWDPVIMTKQAEKYSTEHFQKNFKDSIDSLWEQWQEGEIL